jgi:hypothetical protein
VSEADSGQALSTSLPAGLNERVSEADEESVIRFLDRLRRERVSA